MTGAVNVQKVQTGTKIIVANGKQKTNINSIMLIIS